MPKSSGRAEPPPLPIEPRPASFASGEFEPALPPCGPGLSPRPWCRWHPSMRTRSSGSAAAADVVLRVDQLYRVLPAIQIARHTRRIALPSVIAGIGLSIIAMIAASVGFLPPVEGALLQEVIDVAVIFNALRALRK